MDNWYHLLFIVFLFFPTLWFIYLVIRHRKERPAGELQTFRFGSVFNLAVVYTLAFNIVFFIQELFLAWGKNWIGLTAYLYHNNHNWEGSDPRTSLLQGSGALAIFIFGVLITLVFYGIRNRNWPQWVKLLIWWLGFQGLIQSVAQVQTGFSAPQTDMGQAMVYLGIDMDTGFIIGVIATLVIIAVIRFFMRGLVSMGLINAENRKSHFLDTLRVVVVPSALSVILTIPFRIMPWDRAMMPVFVLLLWLPWVLAMAFYPAKGDHWYQKIRSSVEWTPVFFLVLLLLFFQLVLAPGVKFG